MSNLSNILNFIADYDYTISSFERRCGLPNATIANAKKRGSDLTVDVIETISNALRDDLEAAGYHVMDLRAFGRQELAILSSEEAKKIVWTLGGMQNPTNAGESKNDTDSLGLTVERMAQALADQAAANLKHANNYGAIVALMERIGSKMAKETAQKTIIDKVGGLGIKLRQLYTSWDKAMRNKKAVILTAQCNWIYRSLYRCCIFS